MYLALARAIGAMADINSESESTKSDEIVTNIGASADKSMDWSKQWNTDAQTYYIDELSTVSDQKYTAIAAADYATYQLHQQQGQTELGVLNSILDVDKTVLKGLGDAMQNVYKIMEGRVEFLKALTKAILVLGS